MKKNYFAPEMEVVELKTANVILAGSGIGTDDIIGGDDGSIGGSGSSATDPALIGGGEGL
jgi:hypothetical protein